MCLSNQDGDQHEKEIFKWLVTKFPIHGLEGEESMKGKCWENSFPTEREPFTLLKNITLSLVLSSHRKKKKKGFRMQTPLCRVTVQYTVQNGTPSKRGLFRRNHRSKLKLLGKTKTQG